MPSDGFTKQRTSLSGLLLLSAWWIAAPHVALGQTASLTLLGGSALPGNVVTLPLTLASTGGQPAALQWRVNYSNLDLASVNVAVGPAATAAGKAVQCNATAGSIICILAGINSAVIGNGVAA